MSCNCLICPRTCHKFKLYTFSPDWFHIVSYIFALVSPCIVLIYLVNKSKFLLLLFFFNLNHVNPASFGTKQQANILTVGQLHLWLRHYLAIYIDLQPKSVLPQQQFHYSIAQVCCQLKCIQMLIFSVFRIDPNYCLLEASMGCHTHTTCNIN